jgi:CheY-like chemotaxis protein
MMNAIFANWSPVCSAMKAMNAGWRGTAPSALDMIDERRPSLVLLDVWLHGSPMDGLEVLDAIKSARA